MTTVEWFLVAGVAIALILSVFSFLNVRRLLRQTQTLFQNAENKNALELLNECMERLSRMDDASSELRRDLEGAREMLKERVRRPVLKRYNSFSDVGGNQSFSLALLDAMHTGVVISSLHSRQGAMMYTKWVEEGKPLHNLSKEEQEVLAEALKRS